jgi:hypothetical protein
MSHLAFVASSVFLVLQYGIGSHLGLVEAVGPVEFPRQDGLEMAEVQAKTNARG